MSRTYGKKKPRPKKPGLLLLAAMLCALPCLAADWQVEDRVIRATYSYGSAEAIPGTRGVRTLDDCESTRVAFGPRLTEHDALGVSFAYFLADDFSVEVGGSLPLGDAGAGNLSVAGGVGYHFGPWVVPLMVGYRGDLDTATVQLGAGVDLVTPSGLGLRVKAGPEYFNDSDLEERWGWRSEVAVGWAF